MYEFKVGNYVETKDGKIGHIIGIEDIGFTWECTNKPTPIQFCGSRVNYAEKFNRIGKYDFTKKNKIEPLEYNYEIIRGNGVILKQIKLKMDEDDIVNKINEIIDYINKESK